MMCINNIAGARVLIPEVKRRTVISWTAFGNVYSIMGHRKALIKTERKLFNELMFYWMIWFLERGHGRPNTTTAETLVWTQRKMEQMRCSASPYMTRRAKPGFDSRLEWRTLYIPSRRVDHVSRLRNRRWTIRATVWTTRRWKKV